VLADAGVSGTLACRTGYTLAKTIVERRDEFGVSWFLIDPEAADWTRRGAEMIAHAGKSPTCSGRPGR
jgi:hypothetical protein